MDLETMLAWVIVGAITGIIMDSILGGTGVGITGAILVGVVGAISGAWLFNLMDIRLLSGIFASLLPALIGAMVFLGFLRVTRRT
jgi:uncharacterized membrane protein YeaQ/YmgE (transglycosylase-associated protein family)